MSITELFNSSQTDNFSHIHIIIEKYKLKYSFQISYKMMFIHFIENLDNFI